MSRRDDEQKEIEGAFEPPADYDAYLQEQIARQVIRDVDESETPEESAARREKSARVTQAAVNRYLLGFAEYGTCGDPLRSEPGKLDIALAYAEEAEADDLAVAEPLRDLHWILKEGDYEACAKAVGAAWRSQHPFRPTQSGDPYEMLVPQNDRVRAMIALDQAATLSPPPPIFALQNLSDELDYVLTYGPAAGKPCSIEVALAARIAVQEAWKRLVTRYSENRLAWPLHVDKLRKAFVETKFWMHAGAGLTSLTLNPNITILDTLVPSLQGNAFWIDDVPDATEIHNAIRCMRGYELSRR